MLLAETLQYCTLQKNKALMHKGKHIDDKCNLHTSHSPQEKIKWLLL